MELAKKCGVDIYNVKGKEKTRNQLCNDLDVLKNINFSDIDYDIESDSDSDIIKSPVEPISMLNIPDNYVVPVITNNRPKFTKEELGRKKRDDLVNMALVLNIEKVNNKSIKYQNKPIIVNALVEYYLSNIETSIDTQIPSVIIQPSPVTQPVKLPSPVATKKGLNRKKLD